MTDLRERVARALCEAFQIDPDSDPAFGAGGTCWENCLPEADAAIRLITEECAKVADEWQSAGTAKLRAGELSAAEMRAVKAVSTNIAHRIRQLGGKG